MENDLFIFSSSDICSYNGQDLSDWPVWRVTSFNGFCKSKSDYFSTKYVLLIHKMVHILGDNNNIQVFKKQSRSCNKNDYIISVKWYVWIDDLGGD
jgi:hypothetical protein